jgi:hypothetical protein
MAGFGLAFSLVILPAQAAPATGDRQLNATADLQQLACGGATAAAKCGTGSGGPGGTNPPPPPPPPPPPSPPSGGTGNGGTKPPRTY